MEVEIKKCKKDANIAIGIGGGVSVGAHHGLEYVICYDSQNGACKNGYRTSDTKQRPFTVGDMVYDFVWACIFCHMKK